MIPVFLSRVLPEANLTFCPSIRDHKVDTEKSFTLQFISEPFRLAIPPRYLRPFL